MKRAIVAASLFVIAVVSFAAASGRKPQQGDAQDSKLLQVQKVKDNLFILKGGGGNTAVFVGSSGVVVVDTKLAGWGQPILRKIKELTRKPVTMVINTHSHYDHVSGNVEFPATVDIVAHENTKRNMEAWRPVYGITERAPDVFKERAGKGLPIKTFTEKMTLSSGTDRIDLFYFGRGHTNGDAWVVFPSLRSMHAGDMFPYKSLPIMDVNAGGSGVEYPDTLTKAFDTIKGVDTIITGHSATTMTMNDLKVYADFNREFLNVVRDAKRAGKSVDDVARSWKMPVKYADYDMPQLERVKSDVQVIFNELK